MLFALFFFGLFALVFGTAISLALLPKAWQESMREHTTELLTKPTTIISLVTLALLFNVTMYDVPPGIGWGIFFAAVHLCLFVTLTPVKRSATTWLVTIIGAFASISLGWRANEFVQAVNGVAIFGTVCWLVLVHATEHFRYEVLWLKKFALLYPFAALAHLPVALGHRRKLTGNFRFLSIVKTLFFSTVLLFIFAGILSAADPIFAEKIHVIREQLVPRSVFTLLIVCVLALIYFVKFPHEPQTHSPRLSWLNTVELGIPVLCITVLFGGFLIVQAQYLFGWSHGDFQAYGITYADYVRQGMIHVLWATLGGGILSYALSLKQREAKGTRGGTLLHVLNIVTVIELCFMLISALKRDWMYMETYGLTRVRIVGEVFLFWLCGIIILLGLLAVFNRVREKLVIVGAIGLCGLVLVYLNASNMDLAIARSTPPNKQPKDVLYISRLSLDAAPAWPEMIQDTGLWFNTLVYSVRSLKEPVSPADMRRLATESLTLDRISEQIDQLYSNPKRTWQESHIADNVAMWIIKYNGGSKEPVYFIKRMQCLRREFADLATVAKIDLESQRDMVFHANSSPFIARWYPGYNPVYGNDIVELCP